MAKVQLSQITWSCLFSHIVCLKKAPFTFSFKGLDDSLKSFIPLFDYFLTDLNDWTDEEMEFYPGKELSANISSLSARRSQAGFFPPRDVPHSFLFKPYWI